MRPFCAQPPSAASKSTAKTGSDEHALFADTLESVRFRNFP